MLSVALCSGRLPVLGENVVVLVADSEGSRCVFAKRGRVWGGVGTLVIDCFAV